MSSEPLILRSRSVVTPTGVRPASIHVRGETIERVAEYLDVPHDAPLADYGELTISPGLVDSHVHVNEPGRTEWEGFETATRAAAAGGITTIVDMPLNSIPVTTTVPALMAKAAAMEGKCRVDVGLWGGAVPGNAPQLRTLVDEGALGFKCFLIDSGIEQFGHLDAAGLEQALDAMRGSGAPLLVHAELPGPIEQAQKNLPPAPRSYGRYVRSRPAAAENEAIDLVYRLSAKSGTHAHIVHLSSSGGLERLRQARDSGVPLTAETTPHYLYFEAERIPDGQPAFKCAPPIREHNNREQLWKGVREGLLTAIVSDHSPCSPDLKHLRDGNVERAWGGIASLQFGLPIVWTEGRRRGLGLEDLAALMSSGPATLAGLGERKGKLATGFDADFVIWDPEHRFRVTPDIVLHRHKVTPYAGEELSGTVKATYLRGAKVWEDGREVGRVRGKWLRRP
jgi:allantoinase